MRYQPNRNYVSNDDIQTPAELATLVVEHFRPSGCILEPCCGDGAFLRLMPGAAWCEIKRGRDFFAWQEPVDWIVTNPPWRQIRRFLQHGFSLAREIVFLMTVNHVFTKARLRDAHEAGFGLRSLLLLPTPPEFPQSGFQLGAIHYSRGWQGPIRIAHAPGLWQSRAKRRR